MPPGGSVRGYSIQKTSERGDSSEQMDTGGGMHGSGSKRKNNDYQISDDSYESATKPGRTP